MEKLIIIYKEDKKNPQNTWSGTAYSLRTALSDYYEIIFFDSTDTIFEAFLSKLASKFNRIQCLNPFSMVYEKIREYRIKKHLKKYKHIPVLEIAEDLVLDGEYYVYHDLAYACWPRVIDKLNEYNPKIVETSFDCINRIELSRRIKREIKLIEKSKASFYMGKWVAEELYSYYPELSDKIISVGGGINSRFEVPPIQKMNNKNRILFVGIDFERKGGELVKNAVRYLNNKREEKVQLIIIGTESKKQEEHIEYLGYLDRKEISKEFSKAGVFCMPSYFEAYGLVFVEALCFGIPVVSVNDYEMKYFVKNGINGYLINDYNYIELSNALEYALSDDDMRQNIRADRSRYFENYSWSTVAERIYRIMEEK